jgi:hypothetical protein
MNNLDPINTNDNFLDSDKDGISNYDELVIGSNPHFVDSDNDHFNDYLEVKLFGFLKSSSSQTNETPITRLLTITLISCLFYLGIYFMKKIDDENKNKNQIIYDSMIKEVQNLIDVTNRDYSEINNQVTTLEENLTMEAYPLKI